MPRFVRPKVFLVGATDIDAEGVIRYLRHSGQVTFLSDIEVANKAGIPGGLILCSLYAKMCYKSLVLGKNANLSTTRSIDKNLEATFAQGHGSVFEHCNLNFIVTDCSRIYTHEQVRHRVGAAYSQTSGRYCRLEEIDLVLDPVLEPCVALITECLTKIEDTIYLMECKLGLRKRPSGWPNIVPENVVVTGDERTRWVPDPDVPFDRKKKLTSAIRRLAPNGQGNELGMTLNIRSLRHCLELRTDPAAEWEIRAIYAQVYELVKEKFPLLVADAKETMVEGLVHVHGMKHQPYQRAE